MKAMSIKTSRAATETTDLQPTNQRAPRLARHITKPAEMQRTEARVVGAEAIVEPEVVGTPAEEATVSTRTMAAAQAVRVGRAHAVAADLETLRGAETIRTN